MKNKITFIILFVIIFNNCTEKEHNQEVVLNDIWKLEQTQINSFDPLDAYHSFHIQLVKQLFNTLTDLDSTGQIIPSLAASWESKNGKEWNFYLREDVLFIKDTCFSIKEERKFTADDVKYTFERLLNPASKSLGASYFSNIEGVQEYMNGSSDKILGIKVINNHTVSFSLTKPDYNFPNLLSLPFCSIVKEKAITKRDSKQIPIGTGPFILNNYSPNQSISLIKNPEYWENFNSLPIVDKVEVALVTDDNYSFLLFKNQKTDFLELNHPLVRQLENNHLPFSYKENVIESSQLNFYLFNLSKIQNAEIRREISYAIDRGKMQKLLGNEGTICKSLYPNLFKDICEPTNNLTYQGFKLGKIIKDPMHIKLVVFDDLLSRSMANQVRQDLKSFSIDVEIEAVPFSVLVDRLTTGNYDMIQLYWGMLYADVNHFLTPFKTSSFPPTGNNFNQYSNVHFDSLVDLAQQKPKDQQKYLYKQAEEVILNDMPFVLTYYKNMTILSNNKYTLPMNSLLYKYYKDAAPVE